MRFGVLFELAQDERGNFGRREGFFAELDADHRLAVGCDAEREEFQFVLDVGYAAAHQTLDRIDGAARFIDEQSPGRIAYDDVAGSRQRDYAGDQSVGVFTGYD